MRLLGVFVSRFGVGLSLFVLTNVVVLGCLMVVMRGGVVMSGGLMVMLASWVLCHSAFLLPGLHWVVRPKASWISCGCTSAATPLSLTKGH